MAVNSEDLGCSEENNEQVVAQRVLHLLLSFPSSAIAGVPWRTLVRKYEERFGTHFHTTTSQAQESGVHVAMSLLGEDVLRLVDARDANNPIVALQDTIVMCPCPGELGSWPSLYQAVCSAVIMHGIPEKLDIDGDAMQVGQEPVYGLPLSNLKSMLQLHWHVGFDESSLGYLNENGSYVRFWKLKHLVQAVIQWRELRVAWMAAAAADATALDKALIPTLDIIQSKQYSDIVVRCRRNGMVVQTVAGSVVANAEFGSQLLPELQRSSRSFPRKRTSRKKRNATLSSSNGEIVSATRELSPNTTNPACFAKPTAELLSSTSAAIMRSELQEEASKLRAENSDLRGKNKILQQQVELLEKSGNGLEVLDAVSEEPSAILFCFKSGCVPLQSSSMSHPLSPSATSSTGLSSSLQSTDATVCGGEDDCLEQGQPPLLFLDRNQMLIPKGIVQQTRAKFEVINQKCEISGEQKITA